MDRLKYRTAIRDNVNIYLQTRHGPTTNCQGKERREDQRLRRLQCRLEDRVRSRLDKDFNHDNRLLTILVVAATPDASATSAVNPSSALLQDLLKEQRASRGSRGSTADDADSQVPQTPDRCHSRARSQSLSQSQSQTHDDFVSGKQKKVNTALSAGLRQPREMGVREMDQVSCFYKTGDTLAFTIKLTNHFTVCVKDEQTKLRSETGNLSPRPAVGGPGKETGTHGGIGRGGSAFAWVGG